MVMGEASQQSLHLHIADPTSAPTGPAGLLLLAFVSLWRLPGWAGVLRVQLGEGGGLCPGVSPLPGHMLVEGFQDRTIPGLSASK